MGERGLEDLIGRTIDRRYKLRRLIRQTSKSWVFEAVEEGELSPHRKVAIKILKPGQNEERKIQFEKEVNRLADLEVHPNITTMYGAGRDGELSYVAMELVPGKDLEQEIKSGKVFSLEEILNITEEVIGAVSHINEKTDGHHDIKLKNIKVRQEIEKGKTKKSYVLDLGGRLRKGEDSDDVHAMGSVLKELLKHRQHPQQKIPKPLEQIIDKSVSSKSYASSEDFKNAIENYRRGVGKGITRRKFLKVAGSSLVLSGLGFSGYRYLKHVNSMDYIVEQIAQTEATDYEKINPLFRELALRIFDTKIRWLIESGKIPRGKFPYATIENGSWFLTEGGYWTEGFWPGILWQGFKITEDSQFRDWATEYTKAIDFTEKDKTTIRSIRFYYSHAKAFESTGNEFFRDQALKAAEFMASRFNKIGAFIQTGGEIDNSLDDKKISIDSMYMLPLLLWAYDETKKEEYYDIPYRHAKTTLQFNIRANGSTRKSAVFSPNTRKLIREENSYGYAPYSTYSRGQALGIYGFTLAYERTKNKDFLITAERLADYFINNLPEDFVPFYDFDDPNKNIPKDSSATAITSSALLDLYKITGNEKYRRSAYKMLKSLSSRNYLSTDLKNYQGIIMHGCYNKNWGEYLDSSLSFGDYHFLDVLENKL
ncbi:MAG: glycoside hydrolase family 88 protein [Nanoarchaeota archaeon]|nr:glycoside hydrolase family 88 protein [Nanoarchaeota archaeon]